MNSKNQVGCLMGLLVVLQAGQLPVGQAATFVNTTEIDLVDGDRAKPYPATCSVSGLTGVLTEISVTLSNLNYPRPDDLDVLLVGPRGQAVVLMSDAGGTLPLTNVTLTFGDRFAAYHPDSSRIVPGNYRPSNYVGPAGAGDLFLGPAPAGPYGNELALFNGVDPNGTWNLYVIDDFSDTGGLGRISRGWALTIQTLEPPKIASEPLNQTVAPLSLRLNF